LGNQRRGVRLRVGPRRGHLAPRRHLGFVLDGPVVVRAGLRRVPGGAAPPRARRRAERARPRLGQRPRLLRACLPAERALLESPPSTTSSAGVVCPLPSGASLVPRFATAAPDVGATAVMGAQRTGARRAAPGPGISCWPPPAPPAGALRRTVSWPIG